ncbi:MAG: GIY-YIG nuclease family protein [Sandaracinaceae bacterium]|nr:GIY-YIG nuclease family protein [Sandaracinaceae bacterium]
MPLLAFDLKFGEGFLARVGTGPGVYRYADAEGVVIYVGKAKNLRRRLASYRNAGRKKAHRKMHRIVKAASSLSYEEVASEEAALLAENALIRELRPVLNVEGAFTFLYPAIGFGRTERHVLLCFTTQSEEYGTQGLEWYGTFRSRLRAKLAFDALVELLGLVGHPEKRAALPAHVSLRGSRLVGVRQLPAGIVESLPRFLAGEEGAFLGELARALLERPRARREAGDVQEKLVLLKHFFERDAARLHDALSKSGAAGTFVSRTDRDALFIRARSDVDRGA